MPPLEISKKGALVSLTYSGRGGMSLEQILPVYKLTMLLLVDGFFLSYQVYIHIICPPVCYYISCHS